MLPICSASAAQRPFNSQVPRLDLIVAAAADSGSTSNPQCGLSPRWQMHHLRNLIRRQIPVLWGTSQRAHGQLMFPSSPLRQKRTKKRKGKTQQPLSSSHYKKQAAEGFLSFPLALFPSAILLGGLLDRRPVDSTNHTAVCESRHAVALAYYSEREPYVLKNMRRKKHFRCHLQHFYFFVLFASAKKIK